MTTQVIGTTGFSDLDGWVNVFGRNSLWYFLRNCQFFWKYFGRPITFNFTGVLTFILNNQAVPRHYFLPHNKLHTTDNINFLYPTWSWSLLGPVNFYCPKSPAQASSLTVFSRIKKHILIYCIRTLHMELNQDKLHCLHVIEWKKPELSFTGKQIKV